MTPSFTVRSAVAADADALAQCVNAAYRHYVDRMGGQPQDRCHRERLDPSQSKFPFAVRVS